MPRRVELSVPQSQFVQSTARYVALFGGIGSGKTAGGVFKAVEKINQGEPGIMVGCDFPHFCKSLWPEIRNWFPWSRVTNRHLNHPNTQSKILKVQTPKGTVLVYYGGIDNPASWAGPSVNWFLLDEARRKKTRQAFDVLAGRIRIGNDPQGYITTTPRASLKGQRHWLSEIFEMENFPEDVKQLFAAQGRKIVEYFATKTSDNAKNLDPLYYASLQALYRGKYAQQELAGQFVIFEGLVFENFYTEAGPWGESNVTEEAEYVPGVPIELGVDDGFTKGHPRVFLLTQEIPPYVNVFAEYVATYEVAEESLANMLNMGYPKPDVARVDSSAAEMIHRLWEEDIETSKGSHNVVQGVSHMRAFIRDGAGNVHYRLHPRCEFSIGEMQAYCYPDTIESNLSEASPRAAKPLKEADNAPDASRYLLWPKEVAELIADGGQQPILAQLPKPVPAELVEAMSVPTIELVRMPRGLEYQSLLGRRTPGSERVPLEKMENVRTGRLKVLHTPWGDIEIA